MRRNFALTLTLVLVGLLAAGAAFGQAQRGIVEVTVTDSNGDMVPEPR